MTDKLYTPTPDGSQPEQVFYSGNSAYKNVTHLLTRLPSAPQDDKSQIETDNITPDCEIWKPVVGFEGLYEVSNIGRIKTLREWGKGTACVKHFPYLSPHLASKYLQVRLTKDRKSYNRLVHRLVAETFLGPCPDGYDVNHVDLNKLNNRADNLEYLTHAENLRHAVRQSGSWALRGEEANNSKLTEKQVLEIRQLLAEGLSQRQIANRFGVSQPIISNIKRGLTRSHVKE